MPGMPWNPNAPSIGDHFKDAHNNEPAPAPASSPDINHGIATKAEVLQREAARETPAPARRLTIGGHVEKGVHENERDNNEQRLQQLKASLAKARGRLRDDFDRSR